MMTKNKPFPTFAEAKKEAIKAILILFCLLLGLSTIQAQETRLLPLEEAIQLAIKHNWQLRSDTAQLAILSARVDQSMKSRLPDVGVHLNYTRISDNITPFNILFPTGKVTLNPQILNQSYNSLQLRQLIWDGGKARYGIEIAKRELDAAKFDLERNRTNTVYDVSALWYNLYVLRTSKKIIETNIKTLSLSQQDIKNFVKQGVALENDALKIDLAITNLQSNMIDISNSISALNFNLVLSAGLPDNTVIELPKLDDASLLTQISRKEMMAAAIAARAELKLIDTYKDVAVSALEIAKSNYLPTLSGIASASNNLPEQRLFPNQNKFTPTWFVGLNLNWSISSLFKNPGRVQESRQAIVKTNLEYNQAQERIMMEVNTAYSDYLQASQKIVVSKKAIEQATENFRVEQNRLKAATITSTDFLDANAKLFQAKLDLNAAYANTQLALRKLNKTIGR